MKNIDFFRTIPLFSAMSVLEMHAVADFLEPAVFQDGSIICSEGDTKLEMYIIHSGIVGMYMTQSDGRKRELPTMNPGNFFGEMAVVENEERSSTCYAIGETVLLVLSGLDFYRMVWDYPILGIKLLKVMAAVMEERLSTASGFLNDMVHWGAKARRRAVNDDLSGVFNRRFLEEAINARFSRGFSESRKCSLLMIDFDNFRSINSRYGVEAGDAVIINVGAAFLRIVGETHIPARLSGDEFAVLLPDEGIEEALQLASVLREEIESLYLEFRSGFEGEGEKVHITLSIGAASCPDHATTVHDLFEEADKALYRAKQDGRNRVCSTFGRKAFFTSV